MRPVRAVVTIAAALLIGLLSLPARAAALVYADPREDDVAISADDIYGIVTDCDVNRAPIVMPLAVAYSFLARQCRI